MILLSLSQKRECVSDEKWLVLHPSTNLQTDCIWALLDPEEEGVEEVCWFQGDSNVMAWVTLVDGRALTVRWTEDKLDRPASIKGKQYF